MRRRSFEALWPLFARATRPAKEMTESFSALTHLRPFMAGAHPCRVIHVGDGAHARTGAMFALKSAADNISVDPLSNEPLLRAWRERYGVRRFSWHRSRIGDVARQLDALPSMPVLLTFVHAHVPIDDVLDGLHWDVAFTLACCVPGHQLSRRHRAVKSGVDDQVLSTGQRYQVLVNRGSRLTSDPGSCRT